MKEYKKILFKKHDLFDLAEETKHKELLKMEIKAIIDGVDEPDAQDSHILGLTYYFTQKDELDLNKAHELFIEAIERDQNYHIARLYSAHCYQDKSLYQEALENYLLVDGEFIKQEYALWRYVKLLEQIGYCYYKMDNITTGRLYFIDVLKQYQTYEFDELIFPMEVFQCLDEDDEIVLKLNEIEENYWNS